MSVEASGASEVRTFASAELVAELYVSGHPPARTVEASGGSEIFDVP